MSKKLILVDYSDWFNLNSSKNYDIDKVIVPEDVDKEEGVEKNVILQSQDLQGRKLQTRIILWRMN